MADQLDERPRSGDTARPAPAAVATATDEAVSDGATRSDGDLSEDVAVTDDAVAADGDTLAGGAEPVDGDGIGAGDADVTDGADAHLTEAVVDGEAAGTDPAATATDATDQALATTSADETAETGENGEPSADADAETLPATAPDPAAATAITVATAGTAREAQEDPDTVRETAGILTEFAEVVGDPRAASRLTITGPVDVLPSLYRVTAAATISVAAAAHGAAELWAARSGEDVLPVSIDTRHAAAAFRSERLLRISGRPAPSPWDALSGYYRAGDGRWVQLHCNLPHHRAGVLDLLHTRADPAAVARAVARYNAADLEAELHAMGMCAAMAREERDWWAHPAGRAVAELPLTETSQIADSAAARGGPSAVSPPRGTRAPATPARALSTQAQARPSPARPAAGLRVLDMTRVIAGPVCARVLASFGADVLRVGAAHLPDARALVIDTGFGKRSAFLNLRVASDARRLRELVTQADVVVQAYRPKALDRLGFGPEALARIRPGIVCATISAYGRVGPWSGLRGFDSLVQTAAGIALAGARASGSDRPVPLPAQTLDHATGYLAAYGVLDALARREREGGSWHVRVSLAQTARWLTSLGERDTFDLAEPKDGDLDSYRRTMRSEFGELSYIAPAGSVGGAIHGYDRPPSSLGAHQAGWAPIR
ncbi:MULTISPECIES: CoA transferase [Pseudofrankia]|uniref:CoA transferase n=1 Tax=Pseudofrankia TaxID=2994363 RepID=UPI0018E3F1EF